MYPQTTYGLTELVLQFINKSVEVDAVVNNGDGTYDLLTQYSKWATGGGHIVTIGGVQYTTESFQINESITVRPISGNTPPVTGIFQLYEPKFYYGTIKQVNSDLQQTINSQLLSKDRMPLIWLHGPERTRQVRDTLNATWKYSDCIFNFLTDAEFENWTQQEHFTNAISPMHQLLNEFILALKYSGMVNYDLFEGQEDILDLPRFGNYVGVVGKGGKSDGADNTIFSMYNMSGTQLRLTIPWLRPDCCSTPPVPPQGGESDATFNIFQDDTLIDSFVFKANTDNNEIVDVKNVE